MESMGWLAEYDGIDMCSENTSNMVKQGGSICIGSPRSERSHMDGTWEKECRKGHLVSL